MVVNKRSDSHKSNSSVLKKNVNFGLSGRDIPKLENIIKRQRQRAQSIAKQLLDRKTTSGGRIGKMKQKEMLEEQRDNNVRAFENEKILIKLKARLLNIKRDKKAPKKLTLSDYNIDFDAPQLEAAARWATDTKSPSKKDSFKLNIKNIRKKNNLIDERTRKRKALNGLITRDVEKLRMCVEKYNDKRFMSTRSDSTKTPSDNSNIVKLKTSSSDDIENLNINVSSDKEKFVKKIVSPKKKEEFVKKVLPKRKEKLVKEKKLTNSRKEEKDLFIKKRKIFLDRLKKLNVTSLRKCMVQNVSKSKDDSDSIDEMLDKMSRNLSRTSGSSSGKRSFEPAMMDWATNRAQDYVMKNRNDNVNKKRPIWENEIPTYEMSKEARNLLNNPPKHFLYGKKEKVVIPKNNSWSDQVDVFRVIHTNRIPLDLITPTGQTEVAVEVQLFHLLGLGPRPTGKTSVSPRKVMVPMITKDDVIRAYKDNYYANITSVFTRREIKFKDSKAQHFAYDNKIDVSLLYPIGYLKNRLNYKKKPTKAQAKKLSEQLKRLLERWNTTGITLIDLQGHVNNKPKYKLTEIEQLLKTVKNIGSGKQNVKQQKMLEKQIKRMLIKLNDERKISSPVEKVTKQKKSKTSSSDKTGSVPIVYRHHRTDGAGRHIGHSSISLLTRSSQRISNQLADAEARGDTAGVRALMEAVRRKALGLSSVSTPKTKSVSSGPSMIGEENIIEELLNTDRMSSNNSVKMQGKKAQNIRDFKLLKEALNILREKMAFIPVISPKNRNILEPWDI